MRIRSDLTRQMVSKALNTLGLTACCLLSLSQAFFPLVTVFCEKFVGIFSRHLHVILTVGNGKAKMTTEWRDKQNAELQHGLKTETKRFQHGLLSVTSLVRAPTMTCWLKTTSKKCEALVPWGTCSILSGSKSCVQLTLLVPSCQFKKRKKKVEIMPLQDTKF